jgi:hypothetical protein
MVACSQLLLDGAESLPDSRGKLPQQYLPPVATVSLELLLSRITAPGHALETVRRERDRERLHDALLGVAGLGEARARGSLTDKPAGAAVTRVGYVSHTSVSNSSGNFTNNITNSNNGNNGNGSNTGGGGGGDAVTAPLLLAEAALMGNPSAVAALCSLGADPNADLPGGLTALHLACASGGLACAKVLIMFGAGLGYGAGRSGETPLHVAVSSYQNDIVRFLANAGASLETVDRSGRTPLQLAVAVGNTEAVEALINAGGKVERFEADKPPRWDVEGERRMACLLAPKTVIQVSGRDFFFFF